MDENGAPVTNVALRRALAINNAGQILVEAFFDLLDPHEFFLLTPVATARSPSTIRSITPRHGK